MGRRLRINPIFTCVGMDPSSWRFPPGLRLRSCNLQPFPSAARRILSACWVSGVPLYSAQDARELSNLQFDVLSIRLHEHFRNPLPLPLRYVVHVPSAWREWGRRLLE